ncbi:GELS2-like protein [Mya arenaria]|uniref:GELS2-like protein n=1 Tax=Mya arenaria TaxID=6604 RepID=A0ABY7G178_MYAAR|nr:GELS2-like protein [Mya arenaria]
MKGGADSGFRHVKPTEYKPRLLHFHGDRKGVMVQEIPRNKSLLDNTDALMYLKELQGERGGKCKTETLDEDPVEDQDEFYGALDEERPSVDEEEKGAQDMVKELYRRCLFHFNRMDKYTRNYLCIFVICIIENRVHVTFGKDVFILDTKDSVFVWIGSKTTVNERRNAMTYAHNYLMKTDHALVPICCVSETMKNKWFDTAIAA